MARVAERAGRVGAGLLAVVVVALALSWAWSRFRPTASTRVPGSPVRPVRVQVLNGSGEGGVAARVASCLREGGFQVVEVQNADRADWFASVVVARRTDLAGAREVARFLGGPPVIRQAWDSDLADVTVVIGSDRSRLRVDSR
jgi:LytR cell envelope-related transcriptional attenuator